MKTFKLFSTVLLTVVFALNATAQTHDHSKMVAAKTETFKVLGNCEMCKARIEKAVKAEGATNADWDVKTKMLTVTFEPAKTSVDGLSKKLAAVGHDTEKYKATDKAYDALDACCKYPRGK
jgi:copper chaperone CopZ